MAKPSKIRVMISSQCKSYFPSGQKERTLSDIRKTLKHEIEQIKISGKDIFDVWINECAPPKGGTWDSWDVCIEAVKDCDILLVINNGNAGDVAEGQTIGMCHAELMTGLSIAPAKVHMISLKNTINPQGDCNKRFQEYVTTQKLFRGGSVSTEDELKTRVIEALHEAVLRLVQAGVREASKGKFHSGTALDWSRLDFASRQSEMESVLKKSIIERPHSFIDSNQYFIKLDSSDILCAIHAIPASLGVAAARELVGQPFLRDYLLTETLSKRAGPLHIIACHKTATENQAAKLLGFSDATLVTAPFGVFVADPIQKVQFVFINNCRDETTTRHGVQRFFEWLNQTGEQTLLVERAKARARIVKAIAKETN